MKYPLGIVHTLTPTLDICWQILSTFFLNSCIHHVFWNPCTYFLPTDGSHHLNAVRLDPTLSDEQRLASPPKSVSPNKMTGSPSRLSSGRHTSATKVKTPVTVRTLELQPMVCINLPLFCLRYLKATQYTYSQ